MLCLYLSPQCSVASFEIIGLLVPKKKIFIVYGHGGHQELEWSQHLPFTIEINHFSRRPHIKFGLLGQAISEKMLEHYGHNHVYSSPEAGADNPLGEKFS